MKNSLNAVAYSNKLNARKAPIVLVSYKPSDLHEYKIDESGSSNFSKYNVTAEQKVEDSWMYGDQSSAQLQNIIDGKSKFEQPKKSEMRNSKGISVKRRKKFSEFDGEVCIDRYMSGAIDPYVKKTRKKFKSKSIEIYIHMGISGGNSHSKISTFLRACTTEIHYYTKAGFNVTIYSCIGSTNTGKLKGKNADCFTRSKIKEGNKYLDFQRLATTNYVGYFRHFGLKSLIYGMTTVEGATCSSGLGQPMSSSAVREIIEKNYGRNKNLLMFDFNDYQRSKKLPELKVS